MSLLDGKVAVVTGADHGLDVLEGAGLKALAAAPRDG